MKKITQSKFFLKRLCFIPLGLFAFLLTQYAVANPSWAETVFNQTLYPQLTAVVGFMPSFMSFSVFEWVVGLFLVLAISYVVQTIRAYQRSKDKRGALIYRFVMGVLSTLSLIYFVFTLTCGLNYYRYSFTHYTSYAAKEADVADLEQMVLAFATKLEQTKSQVEMKHAATESFSFKEEGAKAVATMDNLAKTYPVLQRVTYSEPKPLLTSSFFSKAGIAGIFFPFTFEANINKDVPPFVMPVTMTHELAHQAGFMREDEANIIAYLACIHAADTDTQYSGYFSAYTHSIRSLAKQHPEAAKQIETSLSEGVKKDLQIYNKYVNSHTGLIQDASNKANDVYLKLNKTNGILDYGRMVELLLLEYQASAAN